MQFEWDKKKPFVLSARDLQPRTKGNDMKAKEKKLMMNYALNTILIILRQFVASITIAF